MSAQSKSPTQIVGKKSVKQTVAEAKIHSPGSTLKSGQAVM
jgi:hypothetical protein